MVISKNDTKYQKSNFLRTHIITKIFEKSYKAREVVEMPHNSFLFFDKNIRIKNGRINQSINRFGKGGLHGQNEILPLPWSTLTGKQLMDALMMIKQKEFYFKKTLNGKEYKVRLKKK